MLRSLIKPICLCKTICNIYIVLFLTAVTVISYLHELYDLNGFSK